VWQKLNDCKDRDVARQVLSSIARRDALASFARMQKIHVTKQDRREDIENKLIEFVIGGKLRTQAIQTLNLKGGSGERQNG
jgi:DNA-binding TFAR19-related protein (PDSD5 family)